MAHTERRIYVHLVWATKDRLPWLVGRREAVVQACIRSESMALGAEVVALNGIADHVHLLVRLPATLSVAALAKQVKGSSAHLVNHELPAEAPLGWQRGYGAFSVSDSTLVDVRRYIERQKERHAAGRLDQSMEIAPD